MKANEKIKQYRQSNGWTQQQMADKVGVCKSTVNQWEMGLRTPGPRSRRDLKAMGCEV